MIPLTGALAFVVMVFIYEAPHTNVQKWIKKKQTHHKKTEKITIEKELNHSSFFFVRKTSEGNIYNKKQKCLKKQKNLH